MISLQLLKKYDKSIQYCTARIRIKPKEKTTKTNRHLTFPFFLSLSGVRLNSSCWVSTNIYDARLSFDHLCSTDRQTGRLLEIYEKA